MERDNLDRWLSEDDTIVPSSGFIDSVMEAVRREASGQAIPFPWKRALPGMIATALAFVVTVVSGFLALNNAPSAQNSASGLMASLARGIVDGGTSAAVAWAVLAAIMTVVPAMLSMRLTRGYQ